MSELAGRTVIITGATGGLGQGIVRCFAAVGANVVIHSLSPEAAADALTAQLSAAGTPALAVTGDITDAAAMARVAEAVLARFGAIDVLVNNAGIQPVQELAAMTQPEFDAVVAVNLTGTFTVTQAVLGAMRRAGGGSIIHIASIEASLPAVGHAHYAAAKAGVKMHARAAALELGRYGIRVNSVSPGLVDRGDLAETWPAGRAQWLAAVPLGRTASPEDIGHACVFLASDRASFISGHDLVVDGAMSTRPAW
ncbi:MAG: SDR family oxidoreductase [Bifidobacteriaceae bacterium]|jgi:NAD(P)-dependent dehydrogenase (short-subunit alcohol dehydrogenase family)|nr:SDR family oxidoreductase [Bifidobacteriaceae bacterium]